MLTLLAALFQAAISVLVPLPAPPVSPLTADEAYARFVAAFGPEPLCTATDSAGTRTPPGGYPMPGGMHDCPLCPVCASLHDAATALLPVLMLALVVPEPLTATKAFLAADHRLARWPFAPVLARAPPAAV